MGLPTLSIDEIDGVGDLAARSGTVIVQQSGCIMWRDADEGDGGDDAWIVWPRGARQDADRVVLPGGDRLADGATVQVQAVSVALSDLPAGDDTQSYFGSFGRYCDADRQGVLLIAEVAATR